MAGGVHGGPRVPRAAPGGGGLPDDRPGWVKRRLAPYLAAAPWPDFPPAPNGNVCHSVADIEAFGWPMAALWHASYVPRPFMRNPAWINEGGVRVLGARRAGTVLPLVLPARPVWTGLVVDTAVWGSLFYLAMVFAAWARRTRRSKAGRCAGCGYDLRGTPEGSPCPECGAHRSGPGAGEYKRA